MIYISVNFPSKDGNYSVYIYPGQCRCSEWLPVQGMGTKSPSNSAVITRVSTIVMEVPHLKKSKPVLSLPSSQPF